MSESLMLDVGQANEIKLALRREGSWTKEEIKMLCERNGLLTQVKDVVLGRAKIRPNEYIVDLDADPFIPSGWYVEGHKKGGLLKYSPTKVRTYLSEAQYGRGLTTGIELLDELKDKQVMNVNMLDFYLMKEHQHLIPKEWRGKVICFWGTIYTGGHIGYRRIRCLYHNGINWDWRYESLFRGFGSDDVSALHGS